MRKNLIHAPTAGSRAPPSGRHTASEREEALRILYRLRDQWTHKYIPASALESIEQLIEEYEKERA